MQNDLTKALHGFGLLLILFNPTPKKVACARSGMHVVKNPDFVYEESGRVADGTGRVVNPDYGLGDIAVYWDDSGDTTQWTRAAHHGTDVVTSLRPAK